jgi:hypothetical protein
MQESSDPQVCEDARKVAEELNDKYELGFEIPSISESNFYTASLVPPMKDPFLTGQINTTIKKSPPPKYTKKEEIDPSSIEYIIERLTEVGRDTFNAKEQKRITNMLLMIRKHLVPSLEIPDLSIFTPTKKKSLIKKTPLNLHIVMGNIRRKIKEKNRSE